MTITYDLHIHSCLSPCGDDDNTPSNIVGMAMIKGLQVIAVTDHNSCKNCGAAIKVGETYGVKVIPGMELTTLEEVHVVCLFPELENAMNFDAYVYERLMDVKNREDIFGKQQIMDENDVVTGKVDKLLINATSIPFDQVYDLMKEFGGVMIPAHIDKQANSLIANLGFVPPDSQFVTAEVKDLTKLHGLQKSNPYLLGCRILSNSDAHYLGDINEKGYTIEVDELSARCVVEMLNKSQVF
jgi:PHP family Zn ribbon phosphoesterase